MHLKLIILNITIGIMLFATTIVQASTREQKALIAVVKQNSIDVIDLLDNKEITVDYNGEFKSPIINNTGSLIAYLKGKDLYVASTTKNYTTPIKITDNCERVSYSWFNDDTLIYSSNEGGINVFNYGIQNFAPLLESEEVYTNLKCDTNGNIYAHKSFYYGNNAIENLGIIKYNPYSKEEKTIINAVETDVENDNNGLNPQILEVSKDNRYVYIALSCNSASINADGVPFGVYDIKKDEFIKFEDLKILDKCNSMAVNPMNSSKIAFNLGAGRELYLNKTIGYLDINRDSLELLLPQDEISVNDAYSYNLEAKGIVTMNPSFSADGKTLYYAASNANQDGEEQWFKVSHSIYSMDLSSNEIKRITFPENQFDFLPKYIEATKELIFLRTKEIDGECSLWKIKNLTETMITDNIKPAIFNTNSVIDLFIQ